MDAEIWGLLVTPSVIPPGVNVPRTVEPDLKDKLEGPVKQMGFSRLTWIFIQ